MIEKKNNEKKNNEKVAIILFGVMTLLLFLIVLLKVPYNAAPDEEMRYQIAQYICRHMKLPKGDDPEVLNRIWGISYAFTPINSYILSGVIMKLANLMGVYTENLFYYARIVSVLFSMGTVGFCFKIGKKLFEGIYVWLFVVLVTLLPEFIFISGYVNCDAIAVFSVAWIIYALLCGRERGWNISSCLFLGAGLGFCALSYYNAYGIIFFAIVYCVLSVLLNAEIRNKFKFLLERTAWTFLAAFLIAGWWFIRNGILYNGDILGLSASSACGELNALEEFKPSNRTTPFRMGYSLKYMLFDMQWIKISMKSFIAAFGYMQYFVSDSLCRVWYCVAGTGLVVRGMEMFRREPCEEKKSGKRCEGKSFWWCMIAMCIITIGISIYYSYFNDFQAQGRYCLPMLIPVALLITSGFEHIGKRMNAKVGKILAYMIIIYIYMLSFYSIFGELVSRY